MIESSFIFVLFVILLALIFDFTNGIHDAANSIATIVSTRGLTPRQAVVWASFFNFIAFLVFGTAVAKTIGSGLIDAKSVTPFVIFAGLIGAIGWNILTWYFGLPTSSSHALIGGYAGAAIARGGFKVIITAGWTKTIIFIFLAPMVGMFLGGVLITAISWFLHITRARPEPVIKWSRHTQLVSAALYSLGHGGNDAQKTMGIIASLLLSAGVIKTFFIPFWVVLAAHAAIGLGTLSGGWRIVKTMGQKIAKLRPIDGSCAETASAISLFGATWLGVPVSTTHVITGAISGTVAARRFNAVHWDVTGRIVWAWLFTIPAASILAAIVFYLLSLV